MPARARARANSRSSSRRTPRHGHSSSPFRSRVYFFFTPPALSENGMDVTEIANFICYLLSARGGGERESDDDDDATTASFTRLVRDIYHARDILIKYDDTPRSIRTMRVWIHLALTPTPVDNDITCSPLSSFCLSLSFSLYPLPTLSLLRFQSLPRTFLPLPGCSTVLFAFYLFFSLSNEHRRSPTANIP